MADGDAGVEYEFMGNPTVRFAGRWQAPRARTISAPHDNCQCESQATCTNSSSISGSSSRYGPGGTASEGGDRGRLLGREHGWAVDGDRHGCSGTGDDWGWLDEVYEKAAGDIAGWKMDVRIAPSPNVA